MQTLTRIYSDPAYRGIRAQHARGTRWTLTLDRRERRARQARRRARREV